MPLSPAFAAMPPLLLPLDVFALIIFAVITPLFLRRSLPFDYAATPITALPPFAFLLFSI